MSAQAEQIQANFLDAIAYRVADIICERMNLIGLRPSTPPEDDDIHLLKGWKAIAEALGMSESKAKSLRKCFGNTIQQVMTGGSVTADKDELMNKYKEICNLQH